MTEGKGDSFVHWNRDTGCRVSQTQVEWAWRHPFHKDYLACGNFWGSLDKEVSELSISLENPSFFLHVSEKHPWHFKCFYTSSGYSANCAKTRNDLKTAEVLIVFSSFKSVRRSTALCHSCAFPKALITASAQKLATKEMSTRNWWIRVTVGRPWKKSLSESWSIHCKSEKVVNHI